MIQQADPFGRYIDYLRLSVTDRCNLRCLYCHNRNARYLDRQTWLNFDELERVVSIFAAMGISRLRLTGGEPLLRKDLALLVKRLQDISGIHDISLSTNATLLARQAQDLYHAGIRRINVSLDSLRADTLRHINGVSLEKVIDGLMCAKAVGFNPIKINMVIMRGINDEEVIDMVEFCQTHGFTLRFIETMPVGAAGRLVKQDHYLSLDHIERQLRRQFACEQVDFPGGGPARYIRLKHTDLYIGFITPLSRHFCANCNRLRMSADGQLYPCLSQKKAVDLRTLLRTQCLDDVLQAAILQAVEQKSLRHSMTHSDCLLDRGMSVTGG